VAAVKERFGFGPELVVDVGNFATLEQAKEKALQVGQDGFCVEGTVIEQEVELVCYPPSVIDHSVIIKTQ
jgi:hypothetical protein